MRNLFIGADVNNTVETRGVYPEAGGATVATRGSALTPYVSGGYKNSMGLNTLTGQRGMGGGASATSVTPDYPGQDGAAMGTDGGSGVLGRALTWWIVLVVLLVVLMWGAQRFGSEGENFKNVRLSFYNIIVITLAAMIGFGVFKTVFGRVQVPGLTQYVQAV